MPDQNQPNQNTTPPQVNNNVKVTPPVIAPVLEDIPPISPLESNLPPIKPEFQNSNPQNTPPPATSSGPAAPNTNVNPVITSGPKKKFGGGRIIATILGLFLLVGGIGAGIVITQQPELFQPKAGSTCLDNPCQSGSNCGPGKYSCYKTTNHPDGCCGGGGGGGGGGGSSCSGYWCTPCGGGAAVCNTQTSITCEQWRCQQGCGGSGCNPGGGNNNGGGGKCGNITCNADQACDTGTMTCQPLTGTGNCKSNKGNCYVYSGIGVGGDGNVCSSGGHWTTCAQGYVCSNHDCVPQNKTPPPGGGGGTAACGSTNAYSASWAALSSAELSKLKAGDNVNFCVSGTPASKTFDMGRFTINGKQYPDTTKVRPGTTQDFCQDYTIPTGVTTFNISAQIHVKGGDWK